MSALVLVSVPVLALALESELVSMFELGQRKRPETTSQRAVIT
jgi:hypothetical protein